MAPHHLDDTRALLACAAVLAGTEHLAVTLRSESGAEVVLSSGRQERLVQNAEFVAGEGPAHDARLRGSVRADAAEVPHRWPLFGRTAVVLGVTSIAAVALSSAGRQVGCLAAFGFRGRSAPPVASLSRAGDALVDALVHGIASTSLADGLDCRPQVHQAAGMIAHRLNRSVDDAMIMLRARAYRDEVDVDALAGRIVRGESTIDPAWAVRGAGRG